MMRVLLLHLKKQSNNQRRKVRNSNPLLVHVSFYQNWHTTAKQLITMNTLRVNFVPHKKELKEGKNLKEMFEASWILQNVDETSQVESTNLVWISNSSLGKICVLCR